MSGVLVVGMGNPGPEYDGTRHNLGFRVVDVLCARLGTRLRPRRGVRALTGDARDGEHRIVLAQPTTYMNLSGEAVAALARSLEIAAADLVVVHDDLDLPPATVRVKRGGGDGGHNGLASITRALGPDYARVRIGIGRPAGRRDAADYVLDRVPKRDESEMAVAVEEAADAVLTVVRDGVAAAQNRFHAPRADPSEQ